MNNLGNILNQKKKKVQKLSLMVRTTTMEDLKDLCTVQWKLQVQDKGSCIRAKKN